MKLWQICFVRQNEARRRIDLATVLLVGGGCYVQNRSDGYAARQAIASYFGEHAVEIAGDLHRSYVDDLTPEMEALLLHLSFQILGTADLPLTAKALHTTTASSVRREEKSPS